MKEAVGKRAFCTASPACKEGLCALPALRQVRVVLPPAHSGNGVSLNHAVELHALIRQHHRAVGPLHKGRPLWIVK